MKSKLRLRLILGFLCLSLVYITACQNASDEEKQSTPMPDELADRLRGQCVECKHCLPCPQDIPIPRIIACLDYVEFYALGDHSQKSRRNRYASCSAKASDCTECEICIDRCPFGVDIIGKMRRAVEVFE